MPEPGKTSSNRSMSHSANHSPMADPASSELENGIDLVDEDARRRFEADWNPRKLDDLESYLPDSSDKKYWPTLEELLYIDLEFSWKEFSQVAAGETVSVQHSPTVRLKSISRRLNLDQNRDLLQRLWDYEQSLKEESKKKQVREDLIPGNESNGLDTLATPIMSTRRDGTQGASSKLAGGIERDFGNYQLLDMLGRGGMGVVYRAAEKKTGRHVALKMIRSNMVSQVDEETRRVVMDRFNTEARAVANIEHPNIVTLYDVGIYNQTPYLSMRLVDGEDLATRIRQSVLDCKTAARYIQRVALAIESAHAKGIIHRDLKPHNILLDAETDQPLVTDFGLAKLNDDGAGLTETGELLGTPGYMSPEQAQGEKVTASTDIYSLGATLYCLVGGRAPFQAADTLKTIEQIVKNPPLSPREVNPEVDVDLNTICLKCLEKDPRRRYETAGELAADLNRYLNNEPIQARPVGAAERSIRWCRRNKLPTTIGISLVLLVAVAIAGILWSNFYRRQADQAAQLNRANADLSFEANQTELFLVAEDQSLKLPGMGPSKKRLLIPLREFFEQFIEINRDYPDVYEEFAFAHFALGKISHELQDDESAISYLNDAVKIQARLLDESPDDLNIKLELSNSLNLRGECHLKSGANGESYNDFELAMRMREQLALARPNNLEYQRKLANTRMNLGNWFSLDQDPNLLMQAIGFYRESIDTREAYLVSVKDKEGLLAFNSRYDQAKCLFNLAATEATREATESSLQNAKMAMKIFGKLHAEKPSDLFVMRDKARCALLLASLDLEKDPSFYFAQIADAYVHITRLYPDESQYYWLAADALTYLGDVSLENAKMAQMANRTTQENLDFVAAEESFNAAWGLIKDRDPKTVDQKMNLVNVCLGRIPIHLRKGENLEASKELELAVKTLQGLAESDHPDVSEKRKRILRLQSDMDRLKEAN